MSGIMAALDLYKVFLEMLMQRSILLQYKKKKNITGDFWTEPVNVTVLSSSVMFTVNQLNLLVTRWKKNRLLQKNRRGKVYHLDFAMCLASCHTSGLWNLEWPMYFSPYLSSIFYIFTVTTAGQSLGIPTVCLHTRKYVEHSKTTYEMRLTYKHVNIWLYLVSERWLKFLHTCSNSVIFCERCTTEELYIQLNWNFQTLVMRHLEIMYKMWKKLGKKLLRR